MKRIVIKETFEEIETSVIEVDRERLFNVAEFSTTVRKEDGKGRIENRCTGHLRGKSFFLGDAFDWVLGKDDQDETVLVPLKKR